MTREEALQEIVERVHFAECINSRYVDSVKIEAMRIAIEALKMAIEALTKPEIVRCRDCKNYDLAPNGVNGFCNRQYATFYSWDFCSYGDRKGEE